MLPFSGRLDFPAKTASSMDISPDIVAQLSYEPCSSTNISEPRFFQVISGGDVVQRSLRPCI